MLLQSSNWRGASRIGKSELEFYLLPELEHRLTGNTEIFEFQMSLYMRIYQVYVSMA